MILTLLLYLVSFLIAGIVFLLPSWTIWPEAFLTGITYFLNCLATINFIFPIDSLFTVILFLINFEVLYFSAKLVIKFFNFVRGTGSGLDI